jgi:hypothetical protein
MAQTSEEMESGYRKIHRWCQSEFRQFTKDTQLEVSPVMNEAVRRLRERPNLLASVSILHSSYTELSVLVWELMNL